MVGGSNPSAPANEVYQLIDRFWDEREVATAEILNLHQFIS